MVTISVVLQPPDTVYVIVAVPAAMPVTTPIEETLAIDGVLLLHVPPPVALLKAVVEPTHAVVLPVIPAGALVTLTTAIVAQPAADVYVIVDVPGTIVVTMPVDASMVATVRSPLLHTPPVVVLLSVSGLPAHALIVPVIADGVAFTVTTAVVAQPAIYVMVVVPDVTPVTRPVESTVALPLLLLLHVPPVVALLKDVVAPIHTLIVPDIADGAVLIVTTLVIIQPVASVYVISEVPADIPVTTPVEEPTVATVGLLLLHVPPDVVFVRLVVAPTQATTVPPIAAGNGLTVSVAVRLHPAPSE
jgi:hypothetical protein